MARIISAFSQMRRPLSIQLRLLLGGASLLGAPTAVCAQEVRATVFFYESLPGVDVGAAGWRARCVYDDVPNPQIVEDCGVDLPYDNALLHPTHPHLVGVWAYDQGGAGPLSVNFFWPDFGWYTVSQGVYPCDTADCETVVVLEATEGSIRGHVRLAEGTPVPGAIVWAFGENPPLCSAPPGTPAGKPVLVSKAVTDSDGAFDFTWPDTLSQLNNWGLPVLGGGVYCWETTGPGPQYAYDGSRHYWLLTTSAGAGPPELCLEFGCPPSWPEELTLTGSALHEVELVAAELGPGGFDPDNGPPPGGERVPEKRPEPAGPAETCPPEPEVGEPVNVITGNVSVTQTDAVLSGIRRVVDFTRTYNSTNAFGVLTPWSGAGLMAGPDGETPSPIQGSGADGLVPGFGPFGPGWDHTYEKRISLVGETLIQLEVGSGRVSYFKDAADGTFKGFMPGTETSWIVETGDTWIRHFKQGGTESYGEDGRLTAQVDRLGNTTAFARNALGQLTSITLPGGRQLTLDYTGNRITRLLGPAGLIATYFYTSGGFLQRVEYPDDTGYRFVYDPEGQLLEVRDLTNRILEAHAYSGGKGVTSEIGGGREKYTLGGNTVTDANGNVTTYEFVKVSGVTLVKKITGSCSACGGGGDSREWGYDELGNVVSFTNAAQKTWLYGYDEDGDLTSVTDPLARTTTYERNDPYGRVTRLIAPGGGETTWTYASPGPESITETVTASPATTRTTTIGYSSAGLTTSITDPRQKTTQLEYNAFGELTKVIDPYQKTTSLGYNSLGWATSVKDHLQHETVTDYDARGRVLRVTNAAGKHVDFEYEAGWRTSTTDALLRKTRYTYDPYGRLKGVEDAEGGFTRYDYDLMSNLTTLTDAKDHATGFHHDSHGRVDRMTYPGGAYDSFSYDSVGRLSTRIDRKNVTSTFSYDDLDRLVGITYSDGTPSVSYGYDLLSGRLTSASNGTDTLSWSYDLAGQLRSETSSLNGSTVSYDYDANGNRKELRLNGVLYFTYGYDDASRLTSIVRGSSTFGFGYDDLSRRSSLTYPNGVVTTYGYDELSRLTSLAASIGATPVTSFTYAHDDMGNRVSKVTPDATEVYDYDALYRLTTVDRVGTQGNLFRYDYDAVGNRDLEQIGDNVLTASYNAKNQLVNRQTGGPVLWRGSLDEPGSVTFTSATVNGKPAQMLPGNLFQAMIDVLPGTNDVEVRAEDASGNVRTTTYRLVVSGTGATYTYDPNGNLQTKTEGTTTWTYEWNATNQLKRVLRDGLEVGRYSYDPLGRRVEKAVGGVTTSYAYDGMDILRENRGGAISTYIHGPWVDEPLAKETTGTLTYFHADGLRSIVKTTDQSGTAISSVRYDGWGNIEAGTPDVYAFTGREWDAEAGLYYYRARYYDPRIGRFISEDPIGFAAGVNFYAYVGNDPIRWIDPFGLERVIVGTIPGPNGTPVPIYVDSDDRGNASIGSPTDNASSGTSEIFGQEFARAYVELALSELGARAVGAVIKACRGKVVRIAEQVAEWLGPDFRVITNKYGDKVFLSADETVKFRVDFNHTAPHANPHVHLEYKDASGKWVKPGPIYPTDVPHK